MDVRVRMGGDAVALLFFNGWSAPASVADRLELPVEWSLITVSDYRSERMELPDLSGFGAIYLVGWSMGVWAAEYFADHFPLPTLAVAINGTPSLISDEMGIPRRVFDGMRRGLDGRMYRHFVRQMCLSEELASTFLSLTETNVVERAREELEYVWSHFSPCRSLRLPWQSALVSDHDLVIPPEAQSAFWSRVGVATRPLRMAPHLPFTEYLRSWREIVER